MRLDSLTPLQLDALREIGGIGAGHAATALSQLVDRPVNLKVPEIEVIHLADVPRALGGPELLVLAVYSRLLGDLSGGMLFVARREAALALVDLLHGHETPQTVSIGHEEEALLRHAASILISAYLAAIARMADLDVLPSNAAMAFDMAGAVMETAIAEVGSAAEDAILVRTAFIDESATVEAGLFFVPATDSIPVLLGRLGVS